MTVSLVSYLWSIYSKTENKILEDRDEQLRKDIIQKVLSIKGGTGTNTSKSINSKMYHQGHNCDILDNTGVYNE